ncbi:MAG: GNAT family N-acetyltransferase [Gemmatimonadales bacterium]|nr:MAG: GNAT family N-acetyltransferase [Gemmatimonadales bacterium]
MKVLSVNVGRPRELAWRGRILTSAIVKEPVSGPVGVGAMGLDGDTQVDRRVHGGVDKAVYLYPSEHYATWEVTLGRTLEAGALGENLTTGGVLEDELHVGDVVEVGRAVLQVAQPRLPCLKLAARYQREDLPRLFEQAGLPGVYFRVLQPGPVEAGDALRVVERHPEGWSIPRVFRLLTRERESTPEAARLAALGVLGKGARETFRKRTGVSATLVGAGPRETAGLADLLRAAGLPIDGFPGDASVVLVAETEGRVAGGVALERWNEAVLLRSLVVAEGSRGGGLGSALAVAAVARARAAGSEAVYLLTETAERFFAGLGFQPVERSELPGALSGSAELQGACPDSAVAMRLELRGS